MDDADLEMLKNLINKKVQVELVVATSPPKKTGGRVSDGGEVIGNLWSKNAREKRRSRRSISDGQPGPVSVAPTAMPIAEDAGDSHDASKAREALQSRHSMDELMHDDDGEPGADGKVGRERKRSLWRRQGLRKGHEGGGSADDLSRPSTPPHGAADAAANDDDNLDVYSDTHHMPMTASTTSLVSFHTEVGNHPIVVDLGASVVRIGFAGEDAPRFCLPAVMGNRRGRPVAFGDQVFSKERLELVNHLERLKYPMWGAAVGCTMDMDGMRDFLHYAITTLMRVDPRDHLVFVVDKHLGSASMTLAHRQKMADAVFDVDLDVAGVLFGDQAYLSCLGSGRRCALVVYSGASATYTMPVVRSGAGAEMVPDALLHASMCSTFAGTAITRRLMGLLGDQINEIVEDTGHKKNSEVVYAVTELIKEQLCYVAQDYAADLTSCSQSSALEMAFQLSGGNAIYLGSERFQATEPLFNRTMCGENMVLQDLIKESIALCPEQYRDELWSNIVLSGQSTLFPGFVERLTRELLEVDGTHTPVIVAMPERPLLPWIGSAMYANLEFIRDRFVTRDMHREHISRFSFASAPEAGEIFAHSQEEGRANVLHVGPSLYATDIKSLAEKAQKEDPASGAVSDTGSLAAASSDAGSGIAPPSAAVAAASSGVAPPSVPQQPKEEVVLRSKPNSDRPPAAEGGKRTSNSHMDDDVSGDVRISRVMADNENMSVQEKMRAIEEAIAERDQRISELQMERDSLAIELKLLQLRDGSRSTASLASGSSVYEDAIDFKSRDMVPDAEPIAEEAEEGDEGEGDDDEGGFGFGDSEPRESVGSLEDGTLPPSGVAGLKAAPPKPAMPATPEPSTAAAGKARDSAGGSPADFALKNGADSEEDAAAGRGAEAAEKAGAAQTNTGVDLANGASGAKAPTAAPPDALDDMRRASLLSARTDSTSSTGSAGAKNSKRRKKKKKLRKGTGGGAGVAPVDAVRANEALASSSDQSDVNTDDLLDLLDSRSTSAVPDQEALDENDADEGDALDESKAAGDGDDDESVDQGKVAGQAEVPPVADWSEERVAEWLTSKDIPKAVVEIFQENGITGWEREGGGSGEGMLEMRDNSWALCRLQALT